MAVAELNAVNASALGRALQQTVRGLTPRGIEDANLAGIRLHTALRHAGLRVIAAGADDDETVPMFLRPQAE